MLREEEGSCGRPECRGGGGYFWICEILGEAHLVGALKVMSGDLKRTGSQWNCLKDRADVLHGRGSGDDASD